MNYQPKRRLRNVLAFSALMLLLICLLLASREPQATDLERVAVKAERAERVNRQRVVEDMCVNDGKLNESDTCIQAMLHLCHPNDGETVKSDACDTFNEYVRDEANKAELVR